MSNIDVSDIQGFSLKGYNFPHARYLLLELGEPDAARAFAYAPAAHHHHGRALGHRQQADEHREPGVHPQGTGPTRSASRQSAQLSRSNFSRA